MNDADELFINKTIRRELVLLLLAGAVWSGILLAIGYLCWRHSATGAQPAIDPTMTCAVFAVVIGVSSVANTAARGRFRAQQFEMAGLLLVTVCLASAAASVLMLRGGLVYGLLFIATAVFGARHFAHAAVDALCGVKQADAPTTLPSPATRGISELVRAFTMIAVVPILTEAALVLGGAMHEPDGALLLGWLTDLGLAVLTLGFVALMAGVYLRAVDQRWTITRCLVPLLAVVLIAGIAVRIGAAALAQGVSPLGVIFAELLVASLSLPPLAVGIRWVRRDRHRHSYLRGAAVRRVVGQAGEKTRKRNRRLAAVDDGSC